MQVIDTPAHPEDLDLKNQLDFERSFEGNVTILGTQTHGTICANLIVGEVQINTFARRLNPNFNFINYSGQ